jgi:hypothetical protein
MSVLNVANLRKRYGYTGTCNVHGVAMYRSLAVRVLNNTIAIGIVMWPRLIICTDLVRHMYA